ncbi:MAG: nucleoside hydrolase [Pseudomonadota bacterium]|nr:nucleoside hydrolase [Pseudomonadota bacterium]
MTELSGMANILIDCDPGHDDAVAILLAESLSNLVSITTVAGNSSLINTTRNALSVTELIGRDIPVHAGASHALDGQARDARHVHGAGGFGGVSLAEPGRVVASEDAVAHILTQARAVEALWLVAIGPLTNIALAVRKEPDLASRVAGLAIMGGSTGSGNATATAEFNIWADPQAAKEVFAAGFDPIVCGLNLTQQFLSDDDLISELRAAERSIPSFVADLYTYMHARMEDLIGVRQAALHDPCAVLAVTHPDLFEFVSLHVDVETEGELTRGMTVFDQRRTRRGKAAPNCKVATYIDQGAARELLLNTL